MIIVRIGDAAVADLRTAITFYNAVSPSLGDSFLLHVEDALDQLAVHPELFQIVFDEIRRIPLHRFPYNLFYRLLNTHIEVIAVLHAHRAPILAEHRAGSQY